MKIFYVRLVDEWSAGRVSIGNFAADDAQQALAKAAEEFPGFFERLKRFGWYASAEQVKPKGAR